MMIDGEIIGRLVRLPVAEMALSIALPQWAAAQDAPAIVSGPQGQPLTPEQVKAMQEAQHRGEAGRRWCGRIWTVLASCAQQGRSAFDFLDRSIVAHFKSQASPSLLPMRP